MKTLLVEAILTKATRIKDRSITFSFKSMREVDNDEFALIDKYFQQPGFLAFKLDEVTVDDIPSEGTQVGARYSPSQLLRHKIFALHMKQGGTKEDFTPFYTKIMAQFEERIQQKLAELED